MAPQDYSSVHPTSWSFNIVWQHAKATSVPQAPLGDVSGASVLCFQHLKAVATLKVVIGRVITAKILAVAKSPKSTMP